MAETVAAPPEVRAAFERVEADYAVLMSWLHEEGHLDDQALEQVRGWARYVGDLAERRRKPRPYKAPPPENRQPSAGRSTPDPPGTAPGVHFEVSGQRVRMAFEVSKAQFFALEAAGRRRAVETNVVWPLGSWTEETCARWAVQHAISSTYPEIAEAPNVYEEAQRAA